MCVCVHAHVCVHMCVCTCVCLHVYVMKCVHLETFLSAPGSDEMGHHKMNDLLLYLFTFPSTRSSLQTLREECIKLQNRVHDLELQNRQLNLMFQQRIRFPSDPTMQVTEASFFFSPCLFFFWVIVFTPQTVDLWGILWTRNWLRLV